MTRIRRHANPFNVQVEVGRLDRRAVFGREAPLEVELGCGAGGFLLDRAQNNPERDHLGFEVRQPLVSRANAWAEERGLENVRFVFANAVANLSGLVEPGVIVRAHVHFPDPCPKNRHRKRRIMQPSVARALAELMPMGGEVYCQTDVATLGAEMFKILSAERAFAARLGPGAGHPRPVPESTEWERQHEKEGEPIYRMLFEKVREPEGQVAEIVLLPSGPLVG